MATTCSKKAAAAALVWSVECHDRFAAKVVDGRELEVVPSVTESRQVLEIDVEELTGPALFVPPAVGRAGRGS